MLNIFLIKKNTNSCSANAVVNQLLLSDTQKLINKLPSRMFVYVTSRQLDNGLKTPLSDCGASFKSVFEALLMYKFPSEAEYPFNIDNVNKIPPVDIYKSGFNILNPIFSCRKRVPCIYSIKYIISILKLPIMFGMSVFENFIDLDEHNDLLDYPKGDFLGMHAIVLVGYNDVTQTVEILNSHGETFGNRGFFRMSYI